MNGNTNLKYEKQFARAVLSGYKRYEIRKASKGYTSGRKNLVSIGGTLNSPSEGGWQPNKIYGSAYYKLIGANNEMLKLRDIDNFAKVYWVIRVSDLDKNIECNGGQHIRIDKDTYEFAKENYIDKDIDYVVFEITDIDATRSINEDE